MDNFTSHSNGSMLNLLVIDRDPRALDAIKQGLERAGHRVQMAHSGIEAARLFEHAPPDVAIIESGVTLFGSARLAPLLACLSPRGRRVPIVALNTDGDEPTPALEGVDAAVSKPVVVETLVKLAVDLRHKSSEATKQAFEHDIDGHPPVDLSAALARLGGDKKLLRDLIGFFFEDAFPLQFEIHRAIARNDLPSARRSAHALKGLAANFTAAGARAALQIIEDLPDEPADLKQLERNVDREIARTAIALADFVDRD